MELFMGETEIKRAYTPNVVVSNEMLYLNKRNNSIYEKNNINT